MAEAPFDGAVKVTAAPDTGLPSLSWSVADSGLPKAADVLADWPSPAVAVNCDGLPATMLNELALPGAASEALLLDAVS